MGRNMKAIKEIIITYLAIWGFILIVPFFLIVLAWAAALAQLVLTFLGFGENIIIGGMLVASILSMWLLGNLYSAVRFKQMERKVEKSASK